MPTDVDYLNTEPLLRRIVWRHQQRYGGDHEELLAEAQYHYVLACKKYSPQDSNSSLEGWVSWFVPKQLLQSVRTERRHSKLLSRKELPMDSLNACKRFDLHALLADLSEDAQAIVQLTVGPHLSSLVGCKNKNWQPKAMHQRAALIRFLGRIGWTLRRIQDTFQEIREALS